MQLRRKECWLTDHLQDDLDNPRRLHPEVHPAPVGAPVLRPRVLEVHDGRPEVGAQPRPPPQEAVVLEDEWILNIDPIFLMSQQTEVFLSLYSTVGLSVETLDVASIVININVFKLYSWKTDFVEHLTRGALDCLVGVQS